MTRGWCATRRCAWRSAWTFAGRKEVLGLWIEQTEGAKFWLSVMNEFRARGVADVLIAVVDGLKGFPDAIEAVFPQATVQTCIVHLIRRSLAYASYQERRPAGGGAQGPSIGRRRRRPRRRPGCLRGRSVGREVPGHREELAQRLGACGAVPGVLAADPAGDPHDQRDREPEQHGASGGAHARALPERPRGDQADPPGAAAPEARLAGAAAVLAPSASRVRDPLRRALRGGCLVIGPRDSHRLSTGALLFRGTAPVDSPWKSLRAPVRRPNSTGARGPGSSKAGPNGKMGQSVGRESDQSGPARNGPDTEFLTLLLRTSVRSRPLHELASTLGIDV